MRIESAARLEQLQLQQQAEVEHQRALDELEIQRQKELAAIEVTLLFVSEHVAHLCTMIPESM